MWFVLEFSSGKKEKRCTCNLKRVEGKGYRNLSQRKNLSRGKKETRSKNQLQLQKEKEKKQKKKEKTNYPGQEGNWELLRLKQSWLPVVFAEREWQFLSPNWSTWDLLILFLTGHTEITIVRLTTMPRCLLCLCHLIIPTAHTQLTPTRLTPTHRTLTTTATPTWDTVACGFEPDRSFHS